jgi:hypothetical protein
MPHFQQKIEKFILGVVPELVAIASPSLLSVDRNDKMRY